MPGKGLLALPTCREGVQHIDFVKGAHNAAEKVQQKVRLFGENKTTKQSVMERAWAHDQERSLTITLLRWQQAILLSPHCNLW